MDDKAATYVSANTKFTGSISASVGHRSPKFDEKTKNPDQNMFMNTI
jgi:hypothetical protein